MSMKEKDEKTLATLDYLRKLCSAREYAPKDIFGKAEKRLGDERKAAELVQTLTEEGFLSAERYAAAFARDKSSIAGWGPVKIRFMLKSKGIDEDTIARALKETDSDKADEKLLKSLIAKKKSLESDPQIKLKLLKFALSRGYEYESASKAVAKVLATEL